MHSSSVECSQWTGEVFITIHNKNHDFLPKNYHLNKSVLSHGRLMMSDLCDIGVHLNSLECSQWGLHHRTMLES